MDDPSPDRIINRPLTRWVDGPRLGDLINIYRPGQKADHLLVMDVDRAGPELNISAVRGDGTPVVYNVRKSQDGESA